MEHALSTWIFLGACLVIVASCFTVTVTTKDPDMTPGVRIFMSAALASVFCIGVYLAWTFGFPKS